MAAACIDLTDRKFGRYSVLRKDESKKVGWTTYWLCECKCGTVKSVAGSVLKNGTVVSCGCYVRDRKSNHEALKDMVYGHLTVETLIDRENLTWSCRCSCGNEVIATEEEITTREKTHCGCVVEVKKVKHGLSTTTEHHIWYNMRARCNNESNPAYPNYGGRGIKVCPEWDNDVDGLLRFIADVGHRPGKEYSLDRLDNSRGYSPDNVAWRTQVEQMNNTRINAHITLPDESSDTGFRTQTLAEWCREKNMDWDVAWNRIRNLGWTAERALTQPVRKIRSRRSKN
jgi:hypothetical protein